jgi:hypothetical protein
MMSPDELGRIAYVAYSAAADYKNFCGEPMPSWGDLPTAIQRAWIAASHAIAQALLLANQSPPVKLVDPGEVKTCVHCDYIWPPGRQYGRCPGCQQIYDG